MSVNGVRNNLAYGFNNPLQALYPLPIIGRRAPTSTDVGEIGQQWIYNNTVWEFTSARTWTQLSGGGGGSSTLTYTAVSSSPYVVLPTDQFIGVNSNSIAVTILLPNAPATGTVFIIKDATGGAHTHNITVTTVGGVVTIDGATTFVMNTALEAAQVLFNGSAYLIF